MSLLADLHQLHLLRPWWLLAALPALLLTLIMWRSRQRGGSWLRAIAPELLQPLLEADAAPQRRHWLPLLLAGWLLATLALSGPAWQQLPQPVVQRSDALVIVLDLSLSMLTQDVTPSRLQRARYKIQDVLTQRREGTTALVAYAGSAHVVAPLTDDTSTLANLLPALSPQTIPLRGSDPAAAIELAIELLRGAGAQRGRILLVSDGIRESDVNAVAARLDARWQLSILGIGTLQGAPLPLDGGFARDSDGSIAIPKLSRDLFERLAQRSNGRYRELAADGSDIDTLLATTPFELDAGVSPGEARQFDQWHDRGAVLALLLLPLAALLFRRGWLLTVLIAPLLLTPTAPTRAESAPPAAGRLDTLWRDLWLRPDQRAARALEAGNPQQAAQQFEDPAWRGAARYRAGAFDEAAEAFAGAPDAPDGSTDYNRGNALARAGQLQQALRAYDAALQHNPELEDARFNRALVEQLLLQQSSQGGSGQPEESDVPPDSESPGQQQQQSGQSSPSDSGDTESHDAQDGDAGESSADNNRAAQQPPASPQPEAADAQASGDSDDDDAQTDVSKADVANRADEKPSDDEGDQPGNAASDELEQQRQQARTEQWLRQIPDDPGGLLQRKFLYEQRLRERDGETRAPNQPAW